MESLIVVHGVFGHKFKYEWVTLLKLLNKMSCMNLNGCHSDEKRSSKMAADSTVEEK